jgi:hypothetical protein
MPPAIATRRHPIGAFKCPAANNNPDRTVMVTCGRGNFRVSAAEALALARDLLLAAGPPGGSEEETCVWCRAKPARLLLCEACKLKLAGV